MAISRRRTRRGRPARDPLGPDGWDGVPPTPPAAEARWDGVLGLIAEVDARRDAPPDAPLEPRSTDDGVQILDFSGVSSPVASSLEYLAQTDLMESGFDWSSFVNSPRGRSLRERVHGAADGAAGDMTLEECRMFLLALARQERFADGAVDGAIRSGFVGVVLHRAQELMAG